MRLISLTILITAGSLSPWLVHACSQPQIETAFDTIAPTATDILAVQVESLALEPDPFYESGIHEFRGKIRVLKHYRGSGEFREIKYNNSPCSGLRIDVGGIYVIATNSLAPIIELNSGAAPILHLSGFYTFGPDVVLRVSDTVKRLEAALRGDGTFRSRQLRRARRCLRLLLHRPFRLPSKRTVSDAKAHHARAVRLLRTMRVTDAVPDAVRAGKAG